MNPALGILLKKMSKIKKIYYNYMIGGDTNSLWNDVETESFPPDYFEEPIPALKGYDVNYRHAKCPAWKEYYINTWILKQSFPLGLRYKSEEKFLGSNLGQTEFDSYFELDKRWLDGEYPEVQLHHQYCFWTEDSDVWVEQFPHADMTRLGLEVVPGTFPISVWQRPITLGLKIIVWDHDIWLKKGASLCYIRFSSQRTRDVKFTLQQRPIPRKVFKQQLQDRDLKKWHKEGSWNLIKDRLNKEEKESSCPFNFLWKDK